MVMSGWLRNIEPGVRRSNDEGEYFTIGAKDLFNSPY